MIHVSSKPEPSDFNSLVREPGNKFLLICPKPTNKQYSKNNYWRNVKAEFMDAYEHVCAYSSIYIEPTTGNDTVEHFKPKSTFPALAYEWSNYRLVCGKLNNRKGKKTILDPFHIQNGWFQIVFPSLSVKPNPTLDSTLKKQVQDTIDNLELNNEADCMRSRIRYVENYCSGIYSFDALQYEAPFLASEIIRQGLQQELIDMWNSK